MQAVITAMVTCPNGTMRNKSQVHFINLFAKIMLTSFTYPFSRQTRTQPMSEIFPDVHDAMLELKDLQMDHGDGDTLLGIDKALGATLESVAQGGSSIIKTIGGALHHTLNGVGDLEEKVVGNVGEAGSKVIESTGHAVKDSTTDISNMFHGILGGIGGTIQWCLILAIIQLLLYINRSTLNTL